MSRLSSRGLFAQVEAYFTEFLPRQRGASVHTIRAYRDALALLFTFVAKHQRRSVHSLQLNDLDADMVTRFLDHIELERSNSAATRNCRRAAIRGFFKHLLRNDIAHSLAMCRLCRFGELRRDGRRNDQGATEATCEMRRGHVVARFSAPPFATKPFRP